MARFLQHMIIERARILVGNPETWTYNKIASTVDGRPVKGVADPRARRFCARGALQRVAYELVGPTAYRQAAAAAEKELAVRDITSINDGRGRRAVVRLFDKWLGENADVAVHSKLQT